MPKTNVIVDIETYVEASPDRLRRIGVEWVADAIQQKIDRLKPDDCHDRSVEMDRMNGVINYRETMR